MHPSTTTAPGGDLGRDDFSRPVAVLLRLTDELAHHDSASAYGILRDYIAGAHRHGHRDGDTGPGDDLRHGRGAVRGGPLRRPSVGSALGGDWAWAAAAGRDPHGADAQALITAATLVEDLAEGLGR